MGAQQNLHRGTKVFKEGRVLKLTRAIKPLNFPLKAPDPTLLIQLYSPTSPPPTLSMVRIKEEPLGETNTQPDSQNAAQGFQNTTTQTTRTQKAPRLHQPDPVLAILDEIKENMAAARRQQITLINNQTALYQHAKTQVDDLLQGVGRLIQGADNLAQMMDGVEHKADALTQTLEGTLDDISRG